MQVSPLGFGRLTIINDGTARQLIRDLNTYAPRDYPNCRSSVNTRTVDGIRRVANDDNITLKQFIPPGQRNNGVYPLVNSGAKAGLFRLRDNRWLIATNDGATVENLNGHKHNQFPYDDLNHLLTALSDSYDRPPFDVMEGYLAHERERTHPDAKPISKPPIVEIDVTV